jgi:flagellar motor switch protein FliN/FliY
MNQNRNELEAKSDGILRELTQLFDVPLHISIEVGRLRLRVRELMTLGRGFVIELKKPAGEPFDICVNGVPVARGEVITIEQFSGIRITDVLKSGGLIS